MKIQRRDTQPNLLKTYYIYGLKNHIFGTVTRIKIKMRAYTIYRY